MLLKIRMDNLVGHVLSRFDLTDTDPYTSPNVPLQVLRGEVGLAFGTEDRQPAYRLRWRMDEGFLPDIVGTEYARAI